MKFTWSCCEVDVLFFMMCTKWTKHCRHFSQWKLSFLCFASLRFALHYKSYKATTFLLFLYSEIAQPLHFHLNSKLIAFNFGFDSWSLTNWIDCVELRERWTTKIKINIKQGKAGGKQNWLHERKKKLYNVFTLEFLLVIIVSVFPFFFSFHYYRWMLSMFLFQFRFRFQFAKWRVLYVLLCCRYFASSLSFALRLSDQNKP